MAYRVKKANPKQAIQSASIIPNSIFKRKFDRERCANVSDFAPISIGNYSDQVRY